MEFITGVTDEYTLVNLKETLNMDMEYINSLMHELIKAIGTKINNMDWENIHFPARKLRRCTDCGNQERESANGSHLNKSKKLIMELLIIHSNS